MFYSNQIIDSVIGVLIGFVVIHPSTFLRMCAMHTNALNLQPKKLPKNVRRPTFLVILHEI